VDLRVAPDEVRGLRPVEQAGVPEHLEVPPSGQGGRNPARHVHVAQSAGALLDVRGEKEGRVPVEPVPRTRLLDLLLDETRAVRLEPGTGDGLPEPPIEGARPGDEARLHERGRTGQVLRHPGPALIEGPGRVPHGQVEVPEEGEERPGERLRALFRPVGEEDHDVDVGVRVHLAPPVPADRHEGDAAPRLVRLVAGGEQGVEHVGQASGEVQPVFRHVTEEDLAARLEKEANLAHPPGVFGGEGLEGGTELSFEGVHGI